MIAGDKVVVTIVAGCIREVGGTDFVGHIERGTEGEYAQAHPTMPGWHLIRVAERYVQRAYEGEPMPEHLLAPLHQSMFRALTAAESLS